MKYIPSLYMHLLKVNVSVTSCFAWFNKGNEKYFVYTMLDLKSLKSPDRPVEILGISFALRRLSLAGWGRSIQKKKKKEFKPLKSWAKINSPPYKLLS